MHVHGLARNWSLGGSWGKESSGLAVRGLRVVPGHWLLSYRQWDLTEEFNLHGL